MSLTKYSKWGRGPDPPFLHWNDSYFIKKEVDYPMAPLEDNKEEEKKAHKKINIEGYTDT